MLEILMCILEPFIILGIVFGLLVMLGAIWEFVKRRIER